MALFPADQTAVNQQGRSRLWFGLALLIPLYFSLTSTLYGFSASDRLQDDARQHIVWLLRLGDPELFPDGFIADYYQSLSPPAFQAVYWLAAQLGLDALTWVKIFPILLGVIATAYLFGVAYQLLPSPIAAFATVFIFNQNIWLKEDVMSGTPRALVYPIFAAFLYYLLQGRVIPTLITIALQGWFYPTLVLIEVGVLTVRLGHWDLLARWPQGMVFSKFQVSHQRRDWLLWLGGGAIAATILLPLAIGESPYDPTITLDQMRTLPEFQLGGRAEYFGMSPLRFWTAGRSGIRMPLYPPLIWLGLLLPLVRYLKCPLAAQITPKIRILWDILLPSMVWYGLAHMLMVRLYLPSRYMYHSFRFIMAIAAGLTLTILLEAGWRWWQRQRSQGLDLGQWLLVGSIMLMLSASAVVPAIPTVFLGAHHWIDGKYPDLYAEIAATPKSTLVASLSEETDNIPAFARRSVLVGREFALPYQLGYYTEIRDRVRSLITAQYSPNWADVSTFLQTYRPDLWLIDTWAFNPDYLPTHHGGWLMQYPDAVTPAIAHLRAGTQPAIAQTFATCTVFESDRHRLLDTRCMTEFMP